MNPADFTQKLLKLAEHVIVLEKEVERLKSNNGKKDSNNSNVASDDAQLGGACSRPQINSIRAGPSAANRRNDARYEPSVLVWAL